MISPPFLKPNDKIGIIATARKISAIEIMPAMQLIESWGFEVVLGKNIYADYHQFAGTDQERLHDLQTMINDNDIKAILIARGGYGTMRLIDYCDFSNLHQHPKWIVGYSDITMLHSVCHQLKVSSLHATMPINFFKNKDATNSLKNILIGNGFNYHYNIETHKDITKAGMVSAPIVGGNLSLLYAMQGSDTDIDTKDKILFLEDLDEYLYHIDRMILSLKRAGKFDYLKGLIIGGMTDMKDNTIPFGMQAEEIIAYHVKEFNYPVCYNFPAGHVDGNFALPFGEIVDLVITKNEVTINYNCG
jgi:muramoyltetrapeptide carboxypeptidase